MKMARHGCAQQELAFFVTLSEAAATLVPTKAHDVSSMEATNLFKLDDARA